MKILIVCPKLPYPATDGGRIAILEPLRHLASRGYHITLLAFAEKTPSSDVLCYLKKFCSLEVVYRDTRSHVIPLVLNLLSPVPYTVSKYLSAVMTDHLRKIMAREQFALVHLENLHMAGYQVITRQEFGCPTVLRQQNVESVLAERYASTQKGFRRVYARLHALKLKRFEYRMCKMMDLCLMITPQDANQLRQLSPTARTMVVPAGVDLGACSPLSEAEAPGSIVSVAAMDWPPNADGVVWFHNHVLPLIRKSHPGVRFYIVGKNPPREVQHLARDNEVIVTGFVDDVQSYLEKGSVFVVPLRSGGGMRLKILQAMAASRAIVSTTIGAEGIQVTHGLNIMLADDPIDFALQTTRLLNDASLRRRLGQNARSLVQTSYTWSHAVDLLESSYKQVLTCLSRTT